MLDILRVILGFPPSNICRKVPEHESSVDRRTRSSIDLERFSTTESGTSR
jgi:hypothetical protein